MPLRVGITGGIGSGKSTVAKIFEVLGVPVYYADAAAKKLMHTDTILKDKLLLAFGAQTYVDDQLNRPHLAALVFNNPEKLALLNSIVHPATIADAEKWMAVQNTPYAIKEAALIFETDAINRLDKVIGVYSPAPMRLQRVMQRDGISEAAVMARINQQMNEEEKMRLCDYVITNDESALLIPQVIKIHEALFKIIL